MSLMNVILSLCLFGRKDGWVLPSSHLFFMSVWKEGRMGTSFQSMRLEQFGGGGTGRGCEGRCFFFFFFRFLLGPPSCSWGWLEWRSHGLPKLVKSITKFWVPIMCKIGKNTYLVDPYLIQFHISSQTMFSLSH
jgi:hypothetical protein